tara:strand:+ start:1096 stop:1329 length:234 start_codon:yes stop_codon:yes gene_type:complete
VRTIFLVSGLTTNQDNSDLDNELSSCRYNRIIVIVPWFAARARYFLDSGKDFRAILAVDCGVTPIEVHVSIGGSSLH